MYIHIAFAQNQTDRQRAMNYMTRMQQNNKMIAAKSRTTNALHGINFVQSQAQDMVGIAQSQKSSLKDSKKMLKKINPYQMMKMNMEMEMMNDQIGDLHEEVFTNMDMEDVILIFGWCFSAGRNFSGCRCTKLLMKREVPLLVH